MCVKSKEKHRNPVGFLNLERLQVQADLKLLDGDHDEEAFFFWCEPTKICLFLSDHYDRVMGYKRGRKKNWKKIILAIFSFFQDNLCFLGGDDRKWVSHWNVYLPLLFLLLLRPWYSHCLKGTFCVDLFDEKWFCFVNYVVNFIGFCIILFFVENWVWCYLFSIWSGNVTLFDGQVVCVCVCVRAHVFACVGAWVCIQWVIRRAGDMRRQSDREREKAVVSLLLFLSLAFSPSCGTGFESECIVKQNWLFFFFYAWHAELPVGCFEPNFQKTPQNRFFPRRSLKNLSESAMFRNCFQLRTKQVCCFQTLAKRLCVLFPFFFIKTLQLLSPLTPKTKFCQFSTKLWYSLCDCLKATVT